MTPKEMQELAQLLQNVPGIRSIDLKDVKRLVDLLRASPEVGSIEVKGWFGTGVLITRSGQSGFTATPMMPSPMLSAPQILPATPQGGVPAATPAPSGPALKEIRSPMVGTFYKSPEPGADAYVKVGTRVTPGQTACIIEAMKIMNEIEAEVSGVVREILADDATPVEFGQVLFKVDPNG